MDLIANLISGFSFIGFVFLIPPLVWHIKSHNIPAVSLIFWIMVTTLTGFIDAIIWGGEDFYEVYDGKGYCDVTIRLKIGVSSGKLCALAGLAFQLLMILRANNPAFMDNRSKPKVITDVCICWITPIFVMATSYIVQGKRIVILKYDGCNPVFAPTWVTLVLVSMWNLIWAVVAVILALLTIITYIRKRRDIKDLLKCSNSGLNIRRFARLLIFNLLLITVLLPLTVFYFVQDSMKFQGPFIWDIIHAPQWGETFYMLVDPKNLYDKYINFGLSIIAFLIFGVGSEALDMYRLALIHMKINRIIDIKDPRNKELSKMSTQTRTSTNQTSKSKFTLNSGVSGPTMTDGIDMEFAKVMNDGEDFDTTANTSPNSKTSTTNVFTVDLEKANDISDYLDNQELDSAEEINYIINQGEEDSLSIEFKYNITQK